MLARIQQLIVLTIACAAIAAWAVGAQHGMPWLGAVVIATAVAGYAGAIAIEFWLLRRSYSASDPDRPGVGELLRAWATEIVVAPRVFLWHQPFRSASQPDHLPASARGRPGVVLVHGFFCNRGLWNPWLRRLRAADIPVVAVNLEPVLGSIDSYGGAIGAAVTAVETATGRAPIVVAHSMGGLAVRAWLAAHPDARVERLITIATPHAGTRLARRARSLNAAQMCEGSDWLRALATTHEKAARTPTLCFWSRCDNIVFPTANATLAGADNRELAGAAHVAMAFHPSIIEEVLRSASPPSPGTG
jgi:triacylglycerol esterase/lipase EstA (alpha/beta hydrolase family)